MASFRNVTYDLKTKGGGGQNTRKGEFRKKAKGLFERRRGRWAAASTARIRKGAGVAFHVPAIQPFAMTSAEAAAMRRPFRSSVLHSKYTAKPSAMFSGVFRRCG